MTDSDAQSVIELMVKKFEKELDENTADAKEFPDRHEYMRFMVELVKKGLKKNASQQSQ